MRTPAITTAAITTAALLALAACAPRPGDGTPTAAGSGSCNAADFQSYVGQRIDVLNEVALPEGTRVLFPTTPKTDDAVPARLNIGVGKGDVITEVYCG